ncbi:MAG: hypothetical protein IIB76_09705 [Proteobacteria bacterium]|nr:hypothetical protein [Pseudomonadota bacterium]
MKKLPKNVYPKGPSLYYVRKNKWTRLCRIDAPEEELHRELWKILAKGAGTLSGVMDEYIENGLPKKAMSTQRDYANIIKRQLRPTFGHMRPDDVSSQDIAVYLEHRERKGHGPAGNREISCLSSVFNHGMRIRACSYNPCYGVRRNTEKERTRYVTDQELRVGLRVAHVSLRRILWAAYLTGFRQKDLRLLIRSDVLPEGLRVRQSKDGKHELRQWTDSLRRLVRKELERSQCQRIFTNRSGQPWSLSALQSAMRRLNMDWTFHDIRAKADSDHETGLGLMRRYNRARRLKAVK